MQTRIGVISPLFLFVLLCGQQFPTYAAVLTETELKQRISVFGDGFLVARLKGKQIENPAHWISRQPGEYEYRFVAGSDDGAQTQTERHVPDPADPQGAWQRHIGERTVERFVTKDNLDVAIVGELDKQHGFRVDIDPGVHIPAGLRPGQEWQVTTDLVVYHVDSGELFREGQLIATHTYEGAYRIRTPAGEFDTILIREDFKIHIPPLEADDDRLLFFAEGVGLVAELEAIRASALFVFRLKDTGAKVLAAYPKPDRG